MPPSTEAQEDWSRWFDAAKRESIDSALRALYEALDEDVASRKPTCWLSGKCCHFESYGHQLWVTALEVAWLLEQLDASQRAALLEAGLPKFDGCPFQAGKLCGVHALRPLGCRIYYCDPNAQGWQNDVYEAHLGRLRAMHERHGIEYRYVEWRVGLAEARRWIRG